MSNQSQSSGIPGEPDAGGQTALSVSDLTFSYTGGARPALKGVSFGQGRGELIAVMGASGSGKSTLAKCLNRIIPEFEGGDFRGVVIVGTTSLQGLRVHDVAASVGMVFQDFEAQLFSTNVAHEVAFAMEQVGMDHDEMEARIGPALEAVGLQGFEHRDPTSLSGGEKQRLAIASVLALRPSVVVLDEPTTDLDPEGKAEVFALIRRLRSQGLSLIVIEHESEELLEADRVIIVRDGAFVADGVPSEVMSRLDLLEESGVHPPTLNRVLHLLGIDAYAADIDTAYKLILDKLPSLIGANARESADGPMAPARAQRPGHALADLREVSFSYGENRKVLEGANLRIDRGEFIAVVGQNGSGKTTLAKLIVGLLKPATGTVLLDGRDRSAMLPEETAKEVAYVFQNPDHQIFAPTVWAEVAFGPRNLKLAAEEVRRRCTEVLEAVGLLEVRDRDPFLLSKGERQRLAVASVLVLKPRLLILDEPTTGLDYREQRRMMSLIEDLNRSGVAIMMITHTPWLVAEYARRVALLRNGKIVFDGGVRQFFAEDELLRNSSFRPPEVTHLARRFGTLALTPAEFAAWVKERA